MNTLTKNEKRPVTDGQQQQQVQRGFVSPPVNITETKEGYLLEAEMPGVSKEGLEISLEGNELTLVGHRESDPTGVDLVYRETNNRDYRRTFVLDPIIDSGKIEARIDNGVLKLHLPKAEKVKPRKIAVTE